MPGDIITAEVWVKYLGTDKNNWTEGLNNLMTAIALAQAPYGTVLDGGATGSIGANIFPFPTELIRTGDTETGPKGYLNCIVFDKDFNVKTGGFKRVPLSAYEDGTNRPHQLLSLSGADQIVITEPGYVYIYLSNENDTPIEIYFDDLKVSHNKSTVVSSQDYYPFGLIFNSYGRENSIINKNLYNDGAERQDACGLDVDATKFRMYDPAIARWWQGDPLADKDDLVKWTPYNYSYDSPIRYNDPEGDCPWCAVAGAVIGAGFNAYDQYQEGTLDLTDGKSLLRLGTAALAGGIAGSGVGILAGAAIGTVGEAADQLIASGGKITDPGKILITAAAGSITGAALKGVEAVAVKSGLVAATKSIIASKSSFKVSNAVIGSSRKNIKVAGTVANAIKEGVGGVVSYTGGKAAKTLVDSMKEKPTPQPKTPKEDKKENH